jgi:hypothetical protein
LRVENEDVADLALRMERAAFLAAMPELILVGDEAFTKSPSLLITATMQVIDWKDPDAVRLAMLQDKPPARMVRPVRKVQKTFPNMITVGRALNNDLVVLDESISKLHAYFQKIPGSTRLGLIDAGSTNGTFVNDQRLKAEDTPLEVKAGARLRFARIDFTAMAAGTYWDRARKAAEKPPEKPAAK